MKDKIFDLDKLDINFKEDAEPDKINKDKVYKVLVVDDDEIIHKITEITLKKLYFQESDVILLKAYSGEEAKKMLEKNHDIAVVILDVVMETDNAGLEVVAYLRNVLKNEMTRIIIRTGNPGLAPEDRVMIDYDINDYRNKTDLNATNLVSSVMGSIRNYRDITKINAYKDGLEKVIQSTSMLFNYESLGLTKFLNGILDQLVVLIQSKNALVLADKHFSNGKLLSHYRDYRVIAASGQFSHLLNKTLIDIKDQIGIESLEDFQKQIEDANKEISVHQHYYIGTHQPGIKNHTESYIYIINCNVNDENKSFINLFLKNLSLALDNYLLEQDTDEAMSEMLYKLSRVVEARDGDTGNHVYRVSDVSCLIAERIGLSKLEIKDLRLASMLHDVGKIGIVDAILLKPGQLTEEEYAIMKTHTTIGAEFFKNSKHQLLKMAELIALQHHERWDGNGYPYALKGENISIYARIVSLVDVFDALCHDRVYRKAWTIEESKAYIRDNNEKMFDPNLVKIFFENIDEIVRLDENRCNEKNEMNF